MKPIASILILIFLLASSSAATAQKRRTQKRKPQVSKPTSPQPRAVGSAITITTKNGDVIRGEMLDLSAYSVRIRSGGLESAIALDTIAAISFGNAPAPAAMQTGATGPVRPELASDLDAVMKAFQAMTAETKSGGDYVEYGRLLSELRYQSERFIQRYSPSENVNEARAVALVAGALTDYTWARTIWNLKLGYKSDGTLAESDVPVGDVLLAHPDLRASSASGNRFSGDRLIGGLWKKASEKLDRIRSIVSRAR